MKENPISLGFEMLSCCPGWRISWTKSIVDSTTKTQGGWTKSSNNDHRTSHLEASNSPRWSSRM